MKKRRESRINRFLKSVFKVREWMDVDRLKGYTNFLGQGAKRLFVPKPSRASESFEEAQKRFKLSDEDMAIKAKSLYRLAMFVLIFAVLIFIYGIYHLILWNLTAFFLSMVVMMIALSLAFRYHFWYFQITKRKLGCTIQEWFSQGLMGEKP